MVLRVRIRSGKLQIDQGQLIRLSSYVVAKGDGNKFRTVADKDGGKQPVWEQTLSFHNNPLRVKLEVWLEHPNGDLLVGEVNLDLSQFYQREPYRIEPKVLGIGNSKKLTGEVKLELDFDFEGVGKEDLMNKIKYGEQKKMVPEQKKHVETDLQIGTVVAVGNKKAAEIKKQQEFQEKQQNLMGFHQKPYQKPNTGNQQMPRHQERYDYGNEMNNYQRKIPGNQHHGNKGKNLFEVMGNNLNNNQQGNRKPRGDGWDL